MTRGQRKEKKKKKGRERYLASHLGTTVPPAKKWGFPTLRMLAPAVFHIVLLLPSLPLPQNCLGPGGKVNEEKGEGDQMGDSFNLWALRVLFSAPQARTKGIFLCWGGGSVCSLMLTFGLRLCWDQGGDNTGKTYGKLTTRLVFSRFG